MKVILAHNYYVSAQPSGENTMVQMQRELLTDAGVEVIMFTRTSDSIAEMSKAQKALLPISPIYNRGAQRELAQMIKRERPDVLHLHNSYPLLSPWVIRTAHKHGVPVVHTVHNFRQVCVNGLYFRDGHPCHDCRGRAFPLPAIAHSCYRGSKAQSAVMATTLTVHRPTWRSVDRYIALTPPVAAHLRSFGIPDERITVLPNSVPDPGEPTRPGAGFVFVGRLSPEKGVDLLLDAWKKLPVGSAGTLTVVGDGPLRAQVDAVATSREDIRCLGQVARPEVSAALRASAALVMPSTCEDVLPTVVLEALANGRPVLSTNVGGTPFLIDADGTEPAGWVVEPVADQLAAGFAKAAGEAPGLSEVARQRFTSALAPSIATQSLIEVYRELRGGLGVPG